MPHAEIFKPPEPEITNVCPQPQDWNHEAEAREVLRLDVLSQLQALKLPPFKPHKQTSPFPVWLWDLRASVIRAGFPFALEARSTGFWHELYARGIQPRIEALLAWCNGDDGQDIAEYAVMLAVIIVIVVGTVRLIGSNVNNVFSSVASAVQ